MTYRHQDSSCPLRHLSNVLGGKWKLPIICVLSAGGAKRYSIIKRRLGDITNVMLAKSLRELEEAGLVHREQYNEIPPRVEYSLTDRGREVLPFLTQAAMWAVNDMKHDGVKVFCDECAEIE